MAHQVAGALAQKQAKVGAQLQGVLVRQGGKHTGVAAQDLPNFTSLHPGRILQRQILSLRKPFSEVSLWQLLLAIAGCKTRHPPAVLLLGVQSSLSTFMWLASSWQNHVQLARPGELVPPHLFVRPGLGHCPN